MSTTFRPYFICADVQSVLFLLIELPACLVGLTRMHRQPEHVMTFLLAELGTNGSLDGQQRLVVKGRFAPKNFEGILRRYISKFLNHMFLGFTFYV